MTVKKTDLARLRDEYRVFASRLEQQAKIATPARADTLRAQARAHSACALDLNDLIHERKHPSARRR